MKHVQKITGILLMLTFAFLLTACGSSLQKPTGLEEQEVDPIATIDELPNPIEENEPADEEQSENPEQQPAVEKKEESAKTETAPAAKPKPAPAAKPKPIQPLDKQPAAEKPASKTAEKLPVKIEKPAPKPVEKSAKPAEKPGAKPVEKPTPKPTEKPAAKPDPKPTSPAPAKSKIVYSIVISSTEVPLPPAEMEITDGDTVLSTLIDITRKHKVQMDYRGGQGATAYVEGLANVYEFDRGQGSGWMFRVNGIFPDRGAGIVPLLDGDRVEWLYTTDLGVDLNANLKPFRR